MPTASASIQERRRFPRQAPPGEVALDLVQPPLDAESVNFSEGGLCLRLRQMLEVRSLVRLQLTPGGSDRRRPLTCTGRVTWVMQRLDLRDSPPFLFDTGIEFVNPPAALRQLIVPAGGAPASVERAKERGRVLAPSTLRGRLFVPRLERTVAGPLRWHLVVSVDGMPCFSERYPSERAAVAAWARFKRQQTRR
jgi:hypothetical protein